MNIFFILLISMATFSQVERPGLQDISKRINKDLPEVYDSITKLVTTTVENNNLVYHFIVDVNQKEFDVVMPKVKGQVLKSVCQKKREKAVLKDQKANIVYRYENVKGLSMGEFMITPGQCR